MLKIALLGNPNTGKTSLFNLLTGLNQKVGNYPGVTTEKKSGIITLEGTGRARITDLPGLYSLTPDSADEAVATQFLSDEQCSEHPDIAVVVANATNLKRNLFLYTQVKDLGIPTLLVINMMDEAERKGIFIDETLLAEAFQTPVIKISVRKGEAIDALKRRLAKPIQAARDDTFSFSKALGIYHDTGQSAGTFKEFYKAFLSERAKGGTASKTVPAKGSEGTVDRPDINKLRLRESIHRYQAINEVLKRGIKVDKAKARDLSSKIDRVLTHNFWGHVIFLLILAFIFQAIFSWSAIPMNWIDQRFTALTQWVRTVLPAGVFTDLLSRGVMPGITGVLMFVPQIVILFLFLTLLEESGYMSRVVFLLDKSMRRFGLSGKSVVPMISGVACAIPAILSTRNIENWRERLITIMVTPLMTCSARIPVYTILISIVIPDVTWGIFNLRGLVLMAMYLLGLATALCAALVFKKLLKQRYKSFFILELPSYRMPQFRNVWLNILEKSRAFVLGAGKIILAVSVILWFLASYGYGEKGTAPQEQTAYRKGAQEQEGAVALTPSYKLEHSYLGRMGHFIEPALKPLGYNWKIGIALLSSIAAREVFVGTLATIYSVQNKDDTAIQQELAQELRADGTPLFNLASGVSLLLFYAFAMQCMSTIAVVKRETRSWKWPAIQFSYMTLLAYIASLLAYQLLK